MKPLILAAALLASPAFAQSPFTALNPEQAHPDAQEPMQSHPYAAFIARVQEQLRALGFDAGPVNGDWNAKTQAALTQFQLSRSISASGSLDDPTLAELGVQRDEGTAAAGATAQ
jgi:hypothetical protein